MGAVIKLFQVKNEAVAGTNRLWNKNQNRFYSIKSRSYAVLFQRSGQNQNCVGYGKKFRSLRLFAEHHFSFSLLTPPDFHFPFHPAKHQNAGTSPYFSLSIIIIIILYIYKTRTYRTLHLTKIRVPSSIRKVSPIRTLEHLYNQGLTTLFSLFLPHISRKPNEKQSRTTT